MSPLGVKLGGFSISVHYKTSNVPIFGAPRSTREGDIHVRPHTFLYEIQFQTTFIWTFFYVMRIFGNGEP